jgi:5'-3' exonuclease
MKNTIIIDGNNIAMRNFHKLPELRNKVGEPTGAIYGFFNTLLLLDNKFKPDEFIICWDGGRAAWRRELYPEYKANRVRSETADLFYPQLEAIRRMCGLLNNVQTLHVIGYEADDLIAARVFALKENYQNIKIYSSDEDFVQLVDFGVSVINPKNDEPTEVLKKYDCSARLYLYAKCMAGDSSDNIFGFRGVGIPTALKFIKGINPSSIHGLSSEEVFSKAAKAGKAISQLTRETFSSIVMRNYNMMSLEYAASIAENEKILQNLTAGNFQEDALLEEFSRYNLIRHKERIQQFKNITNHANTNQEQN